MAANASTAFAAPMAEEPSMAISASPAVSTAFEAPMAEHRPAAQKAAAKVDAGRDAPSIQDGNAGQLTDGSIVSWAWVAVAGGVVVGLPFSEYPAGGLVQYMVFGLAVIALPPVAYALYGRLRLRLKNHQE